MLSLSALKYSISVKRSLVASAAIFTLYSVVLFLALFITPLSALSVGFYVLLFATSCYAAQQAYSQVDAFKLSESGLAQRELDGKIYTGELSKNSFYNRFFIFVVLEMSDSVLSEQRQKQFVTIYYDAVSPSDYRLLARLINSVRH